MQEIVGGDDETKVTWHVAIVKKGGVPPPYGVICNGVLLNPTTIITAANCYYDFLTSKLVNLEDHEAWFGLLDVSNMDGKVSKRTLRDIRIHPDYKYDSSSEFSSQHDIAMLRISPVSSRDFKPVCLPPDDTDAYAGICAKTTGWGWINTTDRADVEPFILQGLLQKTITNEECYNFYGGQSKYLLSPERICYSNVEGQNACVGDAGGPLVFRYYDEKRRHTQLV
eukprot:TRINITY_DN13843_c0_g1_i1.p1 TRINITY_DN13843_c0_g1~~TRINITY_DN13843_c0_g1_i1.p1  ORF type:complete len:225 (-),score=31.76 TRINITY_DN13843_c0_g1_i1:229-903(-)